MSILDTECMSGFLRMCADGWTRGWHERNGGNLSYRMSEDDVVQCHQDFNLLHGDHDWHEIGVTAPHLAGSYFVVTGAGCFLRDAAAAPSRVCGIVQLDGRGSSYRKVWGLEGGRPTSEFAAHVLAHEAARESSRVVYHAHCPDVIALSTLLPPDARAWSRALWKCMTEYILFMPAGVGVLPWMLAGGAGIAESTAQLMEEVEAVVWTQHGLFVRGQDFASAFGLAELVEKAAGLYLRARSANGGSEPAYQVSDAQLRAVCEEFGVEPREEYLQGPA